MRRALKRLFWAVLALAVSLPVAWVACNGRWADVQPQPVPEALKSRPVTLPPSRNAFYDMQGLAAPLGEDANAWGVASLQPDAHARPGELSWPKDPLWHCKSAENNCVEAWRNQRARMVEMLAASRGLGQRCDVIAQAESYEEVLPERPASGALAAAPYAQLPWPRFAGITSCLRWFGVRAALAASPREAWVELERANRLARLQLAGSRSLIGTMIGVSMLQNHWLLAANWVASTPGADRASLLPLFEPLPAHALSPRAWVPYEARFFREMMTDLLDAERGCAAVDESAERMSAERLWCRARLGLLPELSIQSNDARWIGRLDAMPAQGPAPCELLLQPAWRDAGPSWPAWRNTFGRMLLDLPGSHWGIYAARQLDLELLRQTLRAQLVGEAVPAGVRLIHEGGAARFSACRAALDPGEAAAILRVPLL